MLNRRPSGPSGRSQCIIPIIAAALALTACDTAGPHVPLVERSLSVEPNSTSLTGAGATATFELVDETGARVPAGSVLWVSLRPAIATVDQKTGRTTALSSGQAVIEARVDGTPVGHALVTVSTPLTPVRHWAVDTVARPDFSAVWGRDDDDIFAVGDRTVIYHYDGTGWQPMASDLQGQGPLKDVGGTDVGQVFAVGRVPWILSYDGQAWNTTPVDTRLASVWAASPTDAFAVGGLETVLRYDGSGWHPVPLESEGWLTTVWGSSPSDVFIGDEDGEIIHYDGTDWSATSAGTDYAIEMIWGSGPDDVYAGTRYNVYRYDGERWTSRIDWTGARRAAGSSASDIWLVSDDAFLHYDGSHWYSNQWSVLFRDTTVRLADVWVSPSGTEYAVGEDGAVARHIDGKWVLERQGTAPDRITAFWDIFPGDVLAVGERDLTLRGTSGGWTDAGPNLYAEDLRDVWGSSEDQVIVVGTTTVLLYRGGVWKRARESLWNLHGVWGAGPEDVFVVGRNTILHYDGERWTRMRPASGGISTLFDLWGTAADDVWAVGGESAGHILHYRGTRWFPENVPDGPPLRGVWGTSPEDVFAVGHNGRILHYDGSAWSPMTSPDTTDLNGVWGTGPTDVYAVGDGVILHYDGTAWSRLEGAPAFDYHSVRGSSVGPVYFGADGRIVVGSR